MFFSVTWSQWRVASLGLSIFVSIPSPVYAQGTPADYERTNKLEDNLENCGQPSVTAHWLPSNEEFWYRKVAPKNASAEFIYVSAVAGLRKAAFDHDLLAKALNTNNIPANASFLPFDSIDLTTNASSVLFVAGNKTWQFNSNGELTPVTGKAQVVIREKILTDRLVQADKSVDTDWGFDGFSREAGPREPREPPIPNVKLADDLLPSNMTSRNRALFSINDFPSKFPNGKITEWYPSPVTGFSVVYDTDPEQQHPVYYVQSSPKNQTQPLLREHKELSGTNWNYLKAGDKIKFERVRLYRNLDEIKTDDALFKTPYENIDLGWSVDGTEYRFSYSERGHRIVRIIGIKLDGTVRSILEESSKTFIDYHSKFFVYGLSRGPANNATWFKEGEVTGKDEMIWASERSGWNHLYMLDMKSGSIKAITQGEWAVRKTEWVDERNRQIWFKGYGMVAGQDYYHAHLARVNFDGTNMKIFTADADGSHEWAWSPKIESGRKYFIDRYSRVDMPAKIVLRSAITGKVIVDLEEGSLDCYRSFNWTVPERFVAPGRDGKTDIYGIIIKPSTFDASKKYPVIEQIYAGPQDINLPHEFRQLIMMHEYAELGFVAVMIEGMGTNWRSKEFHDVCHKNLKDAGFPDRIAWMKKAQETRPWMDLTRVGVYGSSAGGQNAMGALLFHNDFYKVATADSGCHDNRMDKIWWNEAWMGWPVDQSYLDSSNVVNAAKLKGALMLSVGELDWNVDPASTMQASNALIQAGKDHELVVIPGVGHNAGWYTTYGLGKQHDFFVRELMGVAPPRPPMWKRLGN
ncbi:hypothetical protein FKW77_002468 [Venturia effusa]|uniref:dipeptidyl-peptidase IV n=1 Tax=Venturia effusa TaxID=50376 RepID=A0A517LNH6_9PEZI|nr:hypothetical protein FKW77_002468 [Venturia effusa]